MTGVTAADQDPAGTYDRAVAEVASGHAPVEVAARVVEAMTEDERLWCLDGDLPLWAGLSDLARGGYHKRTFPAVRVDRLGVPGIQFSDGPRGVVIGPATCFPVSMARGATWDLDLEERIGETIGLELRAVGADLYGGVCVNVLRHPAWGRAQETYGEDPHHVGELGAALARGVQRHAMACVKHFACNSIENARFKVDVSVDDLALHEVFLPHFRRIVEEGVASVMTAYNAVNGEWCGEHRHLLTDILRDEWGFEGFVISDWIFGLRDGPKSVRAGLDVEMPYRFFRAGSLADALSEGVLSWADVDAAVTRVVATRLRFDSVLAQPRPDPEVMACADHRALAREAAAKSVVLLRNEPAASAMAASGATALLPLDAPRLRRVAVIGRLGAVRNLGDGGSSDVWAPEVVTALDGLTAALPGAEVIHGDGTVPNVDATLAATCDVAIVVVGYTKADEGEYIGADGTAGLSELFPGADDPELARRFSEAIAANPGAEPPPVLSQESADMGFATGGDRESLRLHPDDEELISAVVGSQPATVVCVVAGSAVLMPWVQSVPAVVVSWYAGMEGGHGLADVLLGRVDAGGRLPFTIPTDADHLPPFDRDADAIVYDAWHGWWRLDRDGHSPAFPFGFGLSFTSFEITDTKAAVADNGDISVRFTVRNTGERRGVQVVQVYGEAIDDPDAKLRPARRLLGFVRVELEPGDSDAIDLTIVAAKLQRRDTATRSWTAPVGPYRIDIATDVRTAVATCELNLPGG